MASSSGADFSQLFPGPGFEGPGLPRPAYPSQINDLEPLTQDVQSVSVGHHQPEPNPSLNSHPEPWNQQFVNGVNGGLFQHPMNQSYSSPWSRRNYPPPKSQYWLHSTSEMDCSVTGKYHPDSAYYSKSPATQSLFSGEFPASSQHSLTGAMNAVEFPNDQMPYMGYQSGGLSTLSQEAQPSFREQQTENVPELVCVDCEPRARFKNKSELKYVRP